MWVSDRTFTVGIGNPSLKSLPFTIVSHIGPIAEIAEIDAGYVLHKLNGLLQFNIDDFLGAPLDNGQRVLDVSRASREHLDRVAELAQEVLQRRGRKDGPQSILRTKIKGYDKVAILGHMARIVGAERDPTADALVGLGDKLNAAIRRAKEAAE